MKMRLSSQILFILLLLHIASAITPPNVIAYLDPGTGSFLMQIVLASVLAFIVSVKLLWKKIRSFLSFFMNTSATKKKPDPAQR